MWNGLRFLKFFIWVRVIVTMRYGKFIATWCLACALAASAFAQNAAPYTPATVKPSMNDLAGMYAAMKAVVTAQQAAVFADHLKANLPAMILNRQRLAAAVSEAAKSRIKTAEADQADILWQEAVARMPAVETEMARLEKLNVGLAALFGKVRTLLQ